MYRRFITLCFIFLMFINYSVQGEVDSKLDTMIVEGRHVMGDRDSKADARQYALLDAKRQIVESAGMLIKSYSKTENYVLTTDEIESYSVGLVRTEVIEEKTVPSGETSVMIVKVRGVVDPEEVAALLNNVSDESSVQVEINTLHEEYADLKAQLEALKNSSTEQLTTESSEVQKSTQRSMKRTDARESLLKQRISSRSEGWQELERLEILMQIVTESNKKRPLLPKIRKQTKDFIQKYPAMNFARGYLGIAYFKNEQISPAIENLRKALEGKPATRLRKETRTVIKSKYQKQQALFHFYLAQCYRQTGKKRLALRHLREAQRLNPDNRRFR
jgi:tetratricopeptide (TPR) repeat protein